MKRNLILSLITLLCVCQNSWGWCFAHKVIAHIAMQHLTPKTEQMLDYYFDSSIVEYSLWMDRFRQEPSVLALNKNHMGVCNEDFSCDTTIDSPNGNLEAYVVHEFNMLKNYRELPDSTVRTELKFLVHQLGDMHCPAHFYSYDMPEWKSAGKMVKGYKSKYGWFKITYKGKEVTYHALWDLALDYCYPELGEKVGLYTKAIDKDVTPEQAAAMIAGGPYDWGKDRNIRCKQIYDWVKPGDELDETFFQENGWIVDEMVLKAGYRLAHILNQIFDENYGV
ncbi:MAG: S1/P1 nuclease [Bacteroidales bacterium]|nr:hypothetical protein [Bacteroidales bacterium]MBQ6688004.1 S1/P1 nuclease [Bacteroidales bacterium]